MVKEDVVYVECKEEAECVLADFRKRGIPEAVVNEHLVGDLVKFLVFWELISFIPFILQSSRTVSLA